MFSTQPQENLSKNNPNNNNNNGCCASTTTISTAISSCSPVLQSQSSSSSFATNFSAMLSTASALDQNGNARDRTHLTLDLKDLKPRESSNSGLSPISLPMSLLDSSLLMSPEKFLLAAHQHHQNQQNQLQQAKLETPTPSNFIFPKNVTTAQETFADGFQRALQKLQGDSSLPTFQNNSPSTVKFLLSLAALTPTLSPSAPNKSLLGQQLQAQAVNELSLVAAAAAAERKLDVPKIVLNNPTVPGLISSSTAATTAGEALTNPSAAKDLAKRYMEYFQIGQAVSSSANSSSSSSDFLQQVPQFHPPAPAPHIGQQQQKQQQQQQQCIQSNFIKKEPTNIFGNELQQDHLLGLASGESSLMQIASQLNGGTSAAGLQMPSSSSTGGARRKESMSSGGEVGEHDQKKLERKRARNRLAASKCRQRKLQRISDLEAQVAEEREKGSELQDEISRLQSVIKVLQEKLNGCAGIGTIGLHNEQSTIRRNNY